MNSRKTRHRPSDQKTHTGKQRKPKPSRSNDRFIENARCPHCNRIMPSIARRPMNKVFYVGRCRCLGTIGDVKTRLKEDGGAFNEH